MAYRFLRFPGGRSKAVTFSYDDGCETDKRLAKTLTKFSNRRLWIQSYVAKLQFKSIDIFTPKLYTYYKI